MEDGKEAVQDAHGGCGGTTAPHEQQTQHSENTEFQDMEVDNEIDSKSLGKSLESAPGNPEDLSIIGNADVLADGQFVHVEKNTPSSIGENAEELCSESVALVRTIPELKAENKKYEEELNDGVPEVLSFPENELQKEEFGDDSIPSGDVSKEEEIECKVQEVEIVVKNGKEEATSAFTDSEVQPASEMEELTKEPDVKTVSKSFLLDANDVTGDEWGTEEEQAAFMKELETFHRERCLDFKPPKFYQEPLNCLKLWRAVIRLGGYEQVCPGFSICSTCSCSLSYVLFYRPSCGEPVVQESKFSSLHVALRFRTILGLVLLITSSAVSVVEWKKKFYLGVKAMIRKMIFLAGFLLRIVNMWQVTSLKLWRQVGESFRPPKTCTTVSWTFRGFYEKALVEYEKYKMNRGELPFTDASFSEPAPGNQVDLIHASGSGRARRDAAARAMQGWHSHRLLGNGEVGDPIIKDKNPITTPKREKQLRNIGFLKRKGSSPVEHAVKVARVSSKPQLISLNLKLLKVYGVYGTLADVWFTGQCRTDEQSCHPAFCHT
ncbi:hypothetical protein BUALT_Bualt16G0000400 [Buddleja alternifolia]|uniref:ARID domain-containing protein n=1 Tax=Buddleja alternifolia TaxID=168488 RepID=A0AAV6W9B5_9LAMI|nr:hypothetical protein BUALT_Bualt16G0000400 [Buddleja alternifolia]